MSRLIAAVVQAHLLLLNALRAGPLPLLRPPYDSHYQSQEERGSLLLRCWREMKKS